MLSRSRPSLSVVLSTSTIFTNPVDPEDLEPSDDPICSGKIMLTLPKAKKCNRIKVVLTGLSDLGGVGFRLQSSITLRKELLIDLNEEALEAGKHDFIIPTTTAPNQFSPYGRVRHSIVSTLEFSNKRSISSTPASLTIIQNASARTDVLEDLNSVVSAASSALGPVTATFSSPRLSVSSIVHLNINFSSPPTDLSIISIQPFLSETFTLKYDETSVYTLPAQCHALVSDNKTTETLCKKNPTKLQYGVEWNHVKVLRIPGDQTIRPSTLSYTESKLSVRHKFMFIIKYRVEGKGEKEESLVLKTHSVIVGSCQAPIDTSILPLYSEIPILVDSNQTSFTTVLLTTKHPCMCLYSLDELIASSRASGFCQNEGESDVGRIVEIGRREKSPASAAK